jgi:hypothetical protein
MSRRLPLPWDTALPVVVAAAGFGFSLIVLFPGWLSYDSSFQYWQVRTGEFSNLSPVVMTALWRGVHSLLPSPAAMLTLHLAAFWIGIVLLALAGWQGGRARAAFVIGVGFLPPVFVILGHLWTDASLIAAMTLAFGLTTTGLVRRRKWPLALAVPVLLYAGSVRHNSLLAIIPLAWLWASAASRTMTQPARHGAGNPARLGVAAIAVALVLASFLGGRALDHLLARERVSTWAIGALWDLAGISVDSGTVVIPELARTPGMDLESLRARYSPYTGVPLFEGDGRVRHGRRRQSARQSRRRRGHRSGQVVRSRGARPRADTMPLPRHRRAARAAASRPPRARTAT